MAIPPRASCSPFPLATPLLTLCSPPQIAAEPYQSISFKIQAREIDSAEGMAWEHWDVDTKTLSFQFLFAQS